MGIKTFTYAYISVHVMGLITPKSKSYLLDL